MDTVKINRLVNVVKGWIAEYPTLKDRSLIMSFDGDKWKLEFLVFNEYGAAVVEASLFSGTKDQVKEVFEVIFEMLSEEEGAFFVLNSGGK